MPPIGPMPPELEAKVRANLTELQAAVEAVLHFDYSRGYELDRRLKAVDAAVA